MTDQQKPPPVRKWTTRDELLYLDKISRYAKTPEKETLQGYIAGCEKRKDWGEITRAEVMSTARLKLQALGG